MDENQKPTKKELRQQRRLENLARENSESKNNLFKWVIIGVSSILFLGLFIFIIIQNKQTPSKPASIEISTNDWIRGDKNAKVTLVEFSDFECPACKAYEPFSEKVVNDYQGKVRLVYKEYPLQQHSNAFTAASAAEAAGLQGKFWQMHDILFEKQDEWASLNDPTATFKKYASSLKLNLDKFQKDMNSQAVKDKINKDMDEGNNIGLQGTPTFVLDGQILQLPGNYDDFKKIVGDEVNKVEK